jgi:lipopolysaccharide export system permease protein
MKLIKKTDKIVLFPFIRLFLLVLVVTLFIILMQFILIWFDELVGKDLGFWVYVKLLWFFGINATPFALPLAALVASLMVLGSLGEQLELTGLKSAGISFFQIMRPLLIVVGLLGLLAYFSNGYIVPKVTVKAYALLYDLRKTKPAVAIKEGSFYNGIPGYSIRVEKKLPDKKTLEGIMIYKYEEDKPFPNLTVAQSGRLTNLEEGKYLVIELFDGHTYVEVTPEKGESSARDSVMIPDFYRVNFKSQRVLIDLDDFRLNRTKESYFTYYHSTKNNRELDAELDSLTTATQQTKKRLVDIFEKQYLIIQPPADTSATVPESLLDSANRMDVILPSIAAEGEEVNKPADSRDSSAEGIQYAIEQELFIKSLGRRPDRQHVIKKALASAQALRRASSSELSNLKDLKRDLQKLQLEREKRASYAVACLVMLLIGASLGGLIKRGGLGVPLLISAMFILLYYMVDMFATKWAKAELIGIKLGAWASNLVLLPFGLFFLLQAQRDTRLLDGGMYRMIVSKIMGSIQKKRRD